MNVVSLTVLIHVIKEFMNIFKNIVFEFSLVANYKLLKILRWDNAIKLHSYRLFYKSSQPLISLLQQMQPQQS